MLQRLIDIKYKLLISVAFIASFLFWQILKIKTTGIGTDEGNFLFLVELIKNNKVPFLDFYSRESGSLMVLMPFFSIFENTIDNLRGLVIVIHLISVFFLYLSLKRLFSNNIHSFFSLILIVTIFSVGGVFEIYQGIFYHFSTLFSCVLIYLLLLIKEGPKIKLAIILGILCGLGILFYKGIQIFLILIPFIFFIKNQHLKSYLRHVIYFYTTCFLTIILYLLWYASYTNILHVFDIVIGDVIKNIIILAILFIFGGYFLYQKNYRELILNTNIITLIIFTAFLLLIILHISQLGISGLMSNMYAGTVLTYGIFFIILQNITLLTANTYRKQMAVFFALLNITIIYFGYGDRGFFTNIPDWIHILSTIILLTQTVIILFFSDYFFKNNIQDRKDVVYLAFIPIIYFLISSLLGSYIMSTRFESFLITAPILFFLFYTFSRNWLKFAIYLLAILSIGTSFYLYQNVKNDFTFYSYNDFRSAVSYINENLSIEDTVFSLDTSILAETKIIPNFYFYTPWQFSGETPFECISSYSKIYINKDVCLTRRKIILRLSESKPDYILGSWRSTFRIFESNQGNQLMNNYSEIARFGNITIYKLDKMNSPNMD